MGLGPGKYDKELEAAVKLTGARALVLIVVGGKYGNGMSAIGTAEDCVELAAVMRQTASQLEADAREMVRLEAAIGSSEEPS